ncbi:hypothetical protein [Jannaschia rubra]|uniref:Uncharacterized protein n=1 Tax=Jannaschia rubra TaxID=282197 RepID=A0A0M6XM27_9RHOB|nr:hypothetical protein [Jannaschia rubra]CTQ31702.1 hypothetical protein JAN5088_00461 [Jannaschia rubra]SFG55988.1 hypothetical protein SAMN04488517_106163 [Jannaschia rubra]
MIRDNRRLDVLFLASLTSFAVLPSYRVRSGSFGLARLAELAGCRLARIGAASLL